MNQDAVMALEFIIIVLSIGAAVGIIIKLRAGKYSGHTKKLSKRQKEQAKHG